MTDHPTLCAQAERWLRRQGFSVVLREPRSLADTGQRPDAIGWRGGTSAAIECKVSRRDFLADRDKPHRDGGGMGDWRFYMAAPDVIRADDPLPPGWRLLHVIRRRVMSVHGVPGNTAWRTAAPFRGDKRCEVQMLVGALRRPRPSHIDLTAAIEELHQARAGHIGYRESFRHREHAAAAVAAHGERAAAIERVLAWMEKQRDER